MVIKEALLAIPVTLTAMFNSSFKLDTFVERWKVATITSLFKTGEQDKLQREENRTLKLCHRLESKYPAKDLHKHTTIYMLRTRRELHLIIISFEYLEKYKTASRKDTRGIKAPVLTNRSHCGKYDRSISYEHE